MYRWIDHKTEPIARCLRSRRWCFRVHLLQRAITVTESAPRWANLADKCVHGFVKLSQRIPGMILGLPVAVGKWTNRNKALPHKALKTRSAKRRLIMGRLLGSNMVLSWKSAVDRIDAFRDPLEYNE